MAGSPISQEAQPRGDYWDEPGASAADRDEAVDVTNPDVPLPEAGADPLARQDQVTGQVAPDAEDHAATQPDMFGTTTHAGNGATTAPYPEGQAGEASQWRFRPAASRRVALRLAASRSMMSGPVMSRPVMSRPAR